jgi:hypothetical protein
MTTNAHRERAIFSEAVERPPGERTRFVEASCGDDRQRHIHANHRHMNEPEDGERGLVHFGQTRGAQNCIGAAARAG